MPLALSPSTCLLHVGTSKTGTSSIQESLFHGLEDRAFHYVNLGLLQAAQYLAILFHDHPDQFWFYKGRGFSATRVRQLAANYEERLRKTLRRARGLSRIPIISAESLWKFPTSNLARVRDFLVAEGFQPRTLVYLRPIKSWMESRFQQRNKLVRIPFLPFEDSEPGATHALHQYSEKLRTFTEVFGQDTLTVRPFVRSKLTSGCVVQDFCQTTGIHLKPDAIRRSNESLSAEATRFLYAQNHFGSPDKFSLLKRLAMIRLLEARKGEVLRFHSSVFDPIANLIELQTVLVARDHGIDISEDLHADDDGPCVREERDLWRFEQSSLDWLAKAAGSAPMKAREGEAAARAVAATMDQLCKRPLIRQRWNHVWERIQIRLRWIRKGD